MQQKKRGFWLFIFSLIPGAGELYMGFRKQGISIMSFCWGLIALAGFFENAIFACVLPVLWFYSFFNVHNLKSMPDEEFYALEDHYIFNIDMQDIIPGSFVAKYRKILAVLLILFGISVLWSSCTDILYALLPSWASELVYIISRKIPSIVIAGMIIILGFYLLSEKITKINQQNTTEETEHYWEPYRPYQQPPVSNPVKPDDEVVILPVQTDSADAPDTTSENTSETDMH